MVQHKNLINCGGYEIVQFWDISGIFVLPSGANCRKDRKARTSANSDSIPNAFQT